MNMIIKHYRHLFKILLIVLAVTIPNCSSNDDGRTVGPTTYDLPIWTSGLPLSNDRVRGFSHDNRIYETEHFLVYSDCASDDFRIYFAEQAEIAFNELVSLFDLPNENTFGILPNAPLSKIQIICNQNDPHVQRSFAYGFMLYTLTSPYCFATEENFFREIKHELTHVFQMYLDGSSFLYSYGWFREGLAEYAADGGFFEPINSYAQFNNYKTTLDNIGYHPLATAWAELNNVPGDLHGMFYSMSGLAMRYLLDPNGYGKTIIDVKEMLIDIGDNGILFETSFSNHMGINIHTFEYNFYDNVEQYLAVNSLSN